MPGNRGGGRRMEREQVMRLAIAGAATWLAISGGVGLRSASAAAGPVTAAQVPRLLLASGLEEPLVATGSSSEQEYAALSESVRAYQHRVLPDDTGALKAFLTDHPTSAWRLALLLNVGLSDYRYGYFSRAINDFDQAWAAGRSETDTHAKALADRAAGELLRMHARLGHAERLTMLLADMQGRGLTGPATEQRDGAKEGLWLMHNRPGVAYLCGPMALKNLLATEGRPPSATDFLDTYLSSPHGVTLAEVSRLADQAKLPHVLIHRDLGGPIPVPSVVHWKVNHFAAIVGQQGDRFHLMDPTFGDGLWVTRKALDEESSGYFLVPGTTQKASWRTVSFDEARQIYGMGNTGGNQGNNVTNGSPGALCPLSASPNSTAGACPVAMSNGPADGGSKNHAMAGYDFKEMLVSLNLTDTPVGYAPPKGPPVWVRISYNQREQNQPTTFSFFNVSPKWTLNWLSYVQDDPTMPGASVTRYVPGGGASLLNGYSTSSHSFAPDVQDASMLTFVGSAGYQRTLKDGSVEVYGLSNGANTFPRLFFLTQLVDPSGNTVNLSYDSTFRLMAIADATGRSTTFAYANQDPLLVTKITDPFGRSATLDYDSSGRLTQVTDVIGIKSQFNYDASSLVDALNTPYGTTQFTYGDNGNARFLQATDPLGYTERLEYAQGLSSIPSSDPSGTVPPGIVSPFNAYLNDRDTFYWDKHEYAVAGGNYTKARNRHWAHLVTDTNLTSDTIESVKYPLEARIWFNHPGETSGAGVSGTYEQATNAARVLDDGSQQLTQTQYLANGNVSSFTDEAGRQTQLAYAANETDVTAVQQQTASGLVPVAQFAYAAAPHLPSSYTDAAGQTTQFKYNAAGQVTQVADALGHSTVYNYNNLGYLTSIINANGKTAYSFGYDSYGRVASSTDSEGWTVKFTYDALDRLRVETFPDKTTRVYTYTNLDLTSVTDRQKRTTQASYDANRNLVTVKDPAGDLTKFGRYENGTLASLTDPNGHTTSWARDLESRVTGKTYADGKGMGYGYEAATSRLLFTADMMRQIRQFSYTPDNQLAGIRHFNAVNPTPDVGFTYDPYFPLLTSMTDGSGTTAYGYGALGKLGALQLTQEAPPFANAAIAYQYDALGRVVARSVGGDAETVHYDPLGRPDQHVDDLGTFTRTYLGQTSQLTSQSNGTLGTTWSYDTNANDRRLIQVATKGGTTYGLSWTDENDLVGQTDSTNNMSWTYTYDLADRLTTAKTSTGRNYAYTYDPASNLGPIQRPQGTTNITSNSVNQVIAVNGVASEYDSDGNVLRDYARTYTWNAENQLIGVSIVGQTDMQTNIRYDGLGRRIAVDTTVNGITSENRYQWCGKTLCQARNSSDVVSRRYLIEGENAISLDNAFYYGMDQISSTRDAVTVPSGGVAAHYDYDPYGTQVDTATNTTDIKYGELFTNQQTGLYLASFRAYDTLLGRWLNRDPLQETGGLNLYRYALGNPLSLTDRSGEISKEDVFESMKQLCRVSYLACALLNNNIEEKELNQTPTDYEQVQQAPQETIEGVEAPEEEEPGRGKICPAPKQRPGFSRPPPPDVDPNEALDDKLRPSTVFLKYVRLGSPATTFFTIIFAPSPAY